MKIMQTRFTRVNTSGAVAILVVTFIMMIVCVLAAVSYSLPHPGSFFNHSDLATYERIQQDMRSGTDYYSSAHKALLAGGYGTRSVFNWRTPLYPWLLSRFPSLIWPQMILCALVLGTLLLTFRMMREFHSFGKASAATLFLTMGLVPSFIPSTILFSEVTAGTLVVLSVSAYGLQRTVLGYAAGITALFIRELAAPYILICLFFAWHEKRDSEVLAWILGIFGYVLYFIWHFHMVQLNIGPNDLSYPSGWLQFGGLGFVISTAAWNGVLLVLPLWVTAVILPLSLLGILGWPAVAANRIFLTVVLYLLTFSVVGKPFNNYWGLMYAPIINFGLPWVPRALIDLIQRIQL